MEFPTEDEVRAMTNREFVSLIESQVDMIDRHLRRADVPAHESPSGPLLL